MKQLLPLLAVLLFTACHESTTVCHKNPLSSRLPDSLSDWTIININPRAWQEHRAHGDVRLDDEDDDGYVPDNACGFGQMGDCNDNDAAIHPGVVEICFNGTDENCNGLLTEPYGASYRDKDGDGFGDGDPSAYVCSVPQGYVTNNTDCNDNNAAINPGAREDCDNGIDEDCNGESCLSSVNPCSGQTWMLKNLDVDTYRNGDSIPHVTDHLAWAELTTGAWCWHSNDSEKGAKYGRLYNWYAVNDPGGLCPIGWHVPSQAEWESLYAPDCLGDLAAAGGKMKEIGYTHWLEPNEGANNSSGFTALGGSNRNTGGSFNEIRLDANFWTSTEYSEDSAWTAVLHKDNTLFRVANSGKKNGNSVRCVLGEAVE